MEVKKIVEGMTAVEVAEVIDSNFKGLNEEKANKIETDEKLSELGSGVIISNDNYILYNKGYIEMFLEIANYQELYCNVQIVNSYIQIQIYPTSDSTEVLASSWQKIPNDTSNPITIGYSSVGIKGYAIFDYEIIANNYDFFRIKKCKINIDKVANIAYSPIIKNYLDNTEIVNTINENKQSNEDSINTINGILYSTDVMDLTSSSAGQYYTATQINNDSNFVVDYYAVSQVDKYKIKGRSIGYIATVVAVEDIGAKPIKSWHVINGSDVQIDEFITIPENANYIAITRSKNLTSGWVQLYKQNKKSNRIDIIESKIGNNSHWTGKRLLAIGDSITAPKQWQKHVGEILGMNVRTHAKGGIGIIQMVDGDGSGQAPEGYDPDNFGVSTIYALNSEDVKDVDVIALMGFYNHMGDIEVESRRGEVADMYPTNNTFCGYLNYAIKRVYQELAKVNNISCKIVLIAPHKYGYYPWGNTTGYDKGKYAVEAIGGVAAYNSLPFINLMDGANINKYNWDVYQISSSYINSYYLPYSSNYNGGNSPFPSVNALPTNVTSGKIATVGTESVFEIYKYNGTSWNIIGQSEGKYPWFGDQLHLNDKGQKRIAEYIAYQLNTI